MIRDIPPIPHPNRMQSEVSGLSLPYHCFSMRKDLTKPLIHPMTSFTSVATPERLSVTQPGGAASERTDSCRLAYLRFRRHTL